MAAPPSTASIEDAFKPAFEEISRRSGVAETMRHEGKTVSKETTFFTRSDKPLNLPFRLPGQTVVLVSFGTAVLAPRPVDSLHPALRVYGAFETREEAVEHSQIVRDLDPKCSLIVIPIGEWALMPQTEHARDDPEEARRRLQLRLQAHRVRQDEEGEAFDRAVNERLERPAAKTTDPDDDEEQEEAEALVYPAPKRLRAGAEVRGQASVALCVVPDDTRGECLVKVMGCFENTADADNWAQNVATRHVTDDDVYVAPTCEWLYPNGETKAASTRYRIDELQRIMDAADRNPQAVQDYKEWKREQDRLKEVENKNLLTNKSGEEDQTPLDVTEEEQ